MNKRQKTTNWNKVKDFIFIILCIVFFPILLIVYIIGLLGYFIYKWSGKEKETEKIRTERFWEEGGGTGYDMRP